MVVVLSKDIPYFYLNGLFLTNQEHVQERAVASLKISQLPAAVSSGLDANLDPVIKLCNYWRRGQNAIIFDDQVCLINFIKFLMQHIN